MDFGKIEGLCLLWVELETFPTCFNYFLQKDSIVVIVDENAVVIGI